MKIKFKAMPIGILITIILSFVSLTSLAEVNRNVNSIKTNVSSQVNINEDISISDKNQTDSQSSSTSSTDNKGTDSKTNKDDTSSLFKQPDKYLDKETIVQGKTIKAKFEKSEKATGIQKHDRDVYVTDDGSTIKCDQKTGLLVYLSLKTVDNNPTKSSEEIIAENEAKSIAENYAKTQCDLSQYTLLKCSFNQYTGYTVFYRVN